MIPLRTKLLRFLWISFTITSFVLALFIRSTSCSTSNSNPKVALRELPDARPPRSERKFTSKLVEDELDRVSGQIKDSALKRIWENAFPNTLDTTVSWHDDDSSRPLTEAFPRTFLVTGDITALWLRDSTSQINPYLHLLEKQPDTKDKVAVKEWDKLYRLALGLLYMQSQAVLTHPYANSFGPPKSAKIDSSQNIDSSQDWVYPPAPNQDSHWGPFPSSNFSKYIPNDGVTIWEGKWEVDSLANFFRLAVRITETSKRKDFVRNRTWQMAADMAIKALYSQQRETEEERSALKESLQEERQQDSKSSPSKYYLKDVEQEECEEFQYNEFLLQSDPFAIQLGDPSEPDLGLQQTKDSATNSLSNLEGYEASSEAHYESEWDRRFKPLAGGVYRFQRATRSASETKSENGFGEPVRYTGMIKSAFRPSDDTTILPFFVPGNAQLAAALSDLADMLESVSDLQMDAKLVSIRDRCKTLAATVTKGIETHAIVHRKDLGGDVYAYEVDGYGSNYFMDDANIPSLLSLPYLGFVKADDPIYLRTRKMILSKDTNKYLFNGSAGWGIGGPHVGYGYAWPMSRSMQILTTTSREEQLDALHFLRSTTANTGLIHESINVDNPEDFVSGKRLLERGTISTRRSTITTYLLNPNRLDLGLPGPMASLAKQSFTS